MKIFVGFGYNNTDEWITKLILPFLEAIGCKVETGEEMQGEDLAEGVVSRIADSDACIGFLTRRGNPDDQGIYNTHRWVIEELTTALLKKIPVFEIREKGISPQAGILGNRQRYEFEDKALLMLELAKFIRKEKSKLTYKTFMLLPAQFSEDIRPHMKHVATKCSYRFLYKAKQYDPEQTKLERMSGGYGIIIKKIPDEEAQIEITVEGPNGICWNSGWVSVGLINVNLQKEY